MTASQVAARSKAKLAQALKTYSAHRPLVQRVLNVTFVVYILGSTYRVLSGHSSRSGKERPKKDKRYGETVRTERVAVCIPPQIAFVLLKYLKVDTLFFQRLSSILRIVIPGIRSKEALLLFIHSSLLVFRTAISLYVAALDGKYVQGLLVIEIADPFNRIVASLVRAQPLPFFWNILRWLLVAIPATWTNSWLSYIQNKLAIAYRTRLTQEVMKQYLGEEGEGSEGKIYYKLG
jgi:ATP-binding cassette subfamily D (ALD) long-chain fatty acid import protein